MAVCLATEKLDVLMYGRPRWIQTREPSPDKAPRGGGSDNDVYEKEANYPSIQAITLMFHREGVI
jgi:hypothetical protein